MMGRSVSVRRIVAAIILLEAVVLYLVLRNNSWVYDDNFFLVLAGQEGFTWHWLTSTQFEHWDIAMHAAYSLQHSLFFFDYRWALVAMLGTLAGSLYLFERILAMLITRRWITVSIALWFGLNILWIRPLQWWAAGVQYFPYTFFDLLCVCMGFCAITSADPSGGLPFRVVPLWVDCCFTRSRPTCRCICCCFVYS